MKQASPRSVLPGKESCADTHGWSLRVPMRLTVTPNGGSRVLASVATVMLLLVRPPCPGPASGPLGWAAHVRGRAD